MGLQPQPPTFYTSLRSQQVVDVHCSNNHSVAVTDAGFVCFFSLSEAFGASGGHISSAAAQYTQLEAVLGLHVKKSWILPLAQCFPYHCSCCVVSLVISATGSHELYVCAAPSNQQRWMQHLGAVSISGLDGNYLNEIPLGSDRIPDVLLFIGQVAVSDRWRHATVSC